MTVYDLGNKKSDMILIQPVDTQSLSMIDKELFEIKRIVDIDLCIKAVVVDDWFYDLSPWKNPPVFGKNAFGDGAKKTLEYIIGLCDDKNLEYFIGGYSLAGLFALWSAYQTDLFKGVAAASPSLWFPGFTEYMDDHDIKSDTVYLSLGDKEGKTKNPIMSTVDERIEYARETLSKSVKHCILEYNSGNHFTDVPERCAKAVSWVLAQNLNLQKNI